MKTQEAEDTDTSIDGKTDASDFRTMITGGGYYVDKTALIDGIIASRKPAYLFTRPRGFGKSLNLSMLGEYFDIGLTDEPDIFEGLEIERLRPNDPKRNAYPVIRLDLCGLEEPGYKRFLRMMRMRMSEAYSRFPELGSSPRLNRREKELYSVILSGNPDEDDLELSLRDLTVMLDKEYRKKAVVLIDEYDSAVNKAGSPKLRKRILDFLSVFLSSALKDNPSLKLAVITGTVPISMTSIYGGLNNICRDNILDSRSGMFWGFTEDEARRICTDLGDATRSEEAEEWYGGYTFGGIRACNPRSILCYAYNGFRPLTYRADTGTENILPHRHRGTGLNDLKALLDLNGEGMAVQLSPSIAFEKTEDPEQSFYSVMAMEGYLNAVRIKGNFSR